MKVQERTGDVGPSVVIRVALVVVRRSATRHEPHVFTF